jgi:hypothetical protein
MPVLYCGYEQHAGESTARHKLLGGDSGILPKALAKHPTGLLVGSGTLTTEGGGATTGLTFRDPNPASLRAQPPH